MNSKKRRDNCEMTEMMVLVTTVSSMFNLAKGTQNHIQDMYAIMYASTAPLKII